MITLKSLGHVATFVGGMALSTSLIATQALAIDIQDVTSPQGHNAWLVEEHSIPMVSLQVVFTGGSSLDPVDLPGAANFVSWMMNEGAGDMDAQAYASALESLAGSIAFSAGRDSMTLSITALSENRDEVIDLALLALFDATFPEDAIERGRADILSSIQSDAQRPGYIASRRFAEMGYAGHPYATPTDGTVESINAMTRDDLIAAHHAVFNSGRTFVGASGDLTAQELGEIVDRIYSRLPEASIALPAYHRFDAPAGVTVIEHPNPQSYIQFGHGGMHRDDDDFMAAFIMNDLFGSGRFSTRLMVELRETRGLTYGISTGLYSNTFGDAFMGAFSTGNGTAAEAIELVRDQFRWLAEGGITQEDLDRTKTYLTGAYPLRFDGNGSIARILASMQFQEFGITYVNERNDLVNAVTLEDINRVAAELAQPDGLSFVVVGQPEGLN